MPVTSYRYNRQTEKELFAWEIERNRDEAEIRWHFQTGDAREKLISLYNFICHLIIEATDILNINGTLHWGMCQAQDTFIRFTDFWEGQIIHGGHPVLRWMAGKVVIDTVPAGNIKVTNEKSK